MMKRYRLCVEISGGNHRALHRRRPIAHQLDIEVMIVSIRAAGMVDQLLNIRGRNVSDFEQAIGRAMTGRCQMCGRALDV